MLVVDGIESGLDKVRERNAETIDVDKEGPVAVVKDLTGGIGVLGAVRVAWQDQHRGAASSAAWAP